MLHGVQLPHGTRDSVSEAGCGLKTAVASLRGSKVVGCARHLNVVEEAGRRLDDVHSGGREWRSVVGKLGASSRQMTDVAL